MPHGDCCRFPSTSCGGSPQFPDQKGTKMSGKKISQSKMSDKKRPNHITASSIEQVALCPDSNNAQKGKPNETNPLASAGNRIHDALEADDFTLLTDDDERDLAERAAFLRVELIEEFFSSQPLFEGVEFNHIKEERLYGLEPEISGRFDGLVLDGNRALLYDYKTGYSEPINAKENLQMRTYAVLVKENYPQVTEVHAAIIQPRIRPEISKVEYSEGDLKIARLEIQTIIEKAHAPNPPRNAGAIQCKYCRAKAECPEASKLTVSLNNLQGAVIPDDKLPELLETCTAAKKIIEAIETRARELLSSKPDSVPGYKLKPGAMKGEVTEPGKLFNRCNERHSILPHEFHGVCDIKKGKLKSLLKEASGLKGKALEEEMESLLNGLVKYSANRSSLARDKKTAAFMPKFKGIADA